MYISKVIIENIRCFSNLEISFNLDNEMALWTMIVGDNATGKTALLKSIAIGLCDESSAAGLMRESDVGYIRHGENNAEINIELKESADSTEVYRMETRIENVPIVGSKSERKYYETLHQTTVPEDRIFPWGKLFVCAYGAGRGMMGTGDVSGYSAIDAVYNMFNYDEGLQNPELIIRRIAERSLKAKENVLSILKQLLLGHLDSIDKYKIELQSSGLIAVGPWGEIPLRDLADGYKSTCIWVTDFLGWALNHDPDILDPKEISGVIIIDEIEQHLHPKWQKSIVNNLKTEFPKVQFIASTHSPIIASSVGSLENDHDQLLSSEFDSEKGDTTITRLPTMEYSRFDQVLASRAFEWQVLGPELLTLKLARASELLDKGKDRSTEEEQEYLSLKKTLLERQYLDASTSIEREVAKEIIVGIEERIAAFEK